MARTAVACPECRKDQELSRVFAGRMACWSHPRRHVFEAQDVDPTLSALPLAWMNQLYDIERRALEWTSSPRNLTQRPRITPPWANSPTMCIPFATLP